MIFYAQQKKDGTPESEAEAFVNPEKGVETAEEAVHFCDDVHRALSQKPLFMFMAPAA